MASNEIKYQGFKSDKLTIFTAEFEVAPLNLRKYVIKHWKDITKGLEKNSTILFIAGVHGSENGKLGGRFEIRKIESQVIFF